MEKSNLSVLLSLAVLLCLLCQGFGAAVPMEDKQNADGTMAVGIDEIFRDLAEKSPVVDDGAILTEYDMLMTPEQYNAWKENDVDKRTATYRNIRTWPNGVVNYEFEHGSFSADEKALIQKAQAEISHFTCIVFKENTENDRVYVKNGTGCSSYVGQTLAVQDLKLAKGCRYHRTVAHEFIHALGIMHEQCRPDRDEFVTIHLENVDEPKHHNFKKFDWTKINNRSLPYDYDSIMHYSKTAFSNNGKLSIVTKDSGYQDTIGKIPNLSMGDIRAINAMYNCVSSSCGLKDSDCGANGWVGKNCKCWCPGPSKNHPVEYCKQSDIDALGSLDFK